MSRYKKQFFRLFLILCSLSLLFTTPSYSGEVRVRGNLGVQGYGYDDADSENHLWLLQYGDLSLYQKDGPLSLQLSGGYSGDNQDDFSTSGSFSFMKGYLAFNRPFNKPGAKL